MGGSIYIRTSPKYLYLAPKSSKNNKMEKIFHALEMKKSGVLGKFSKKGTRWMVVQKFHSFWELIPPTGIE